MTRSEHLEFCKICTQRKLDLKTGLLCSLTGKIADFEDSCIHFHKDEHAEQKEFERKMAATGDYESGDAMDYAKNKRVGTFIFFIGIGITFCTYLYADVFGFYVVTYGTIIYGAVQYYRGVQQEKIAMEYEERKTKQPHD